ncbi:MAG: GlsB/YeaQ/YmgE family stress response membrane protein [Aeromicrobium sp.]|uniref:GlsB/YeaQ/YmgE family stress response membrane protein n=1 Tax=Aeromicrobium sp. TaxID=1871063 RepID=UPI0039E72574
MWGIIIFLIVGLVAGLLARALVPGKDSMGLIATTVLGVVGSFVGGGLWAVFTDAKLLDFNTAGLFLSVVGAIIALVVYNRFEAKRSSGTK